MAKEIKVTGQKKVGTLMKEFNELFPYLGLRLYSPEAKKANSYTPYRIATDVTLASVRATGKKGGDISVSGNKKIKNLEMEFEEVFGLFAQVCYCPKGCAAGNGYVTLGNDDDYTLSSFNEMCKKNGNNIYSYGN